MVVTSRNDFIREIFLHACKDELFMNKWATDKCWCWWIAKRYGLEATQVAFFDPKEINLALATAVPLKYNFELFNEGNQLGIFRKKCPGNHAHLRAAFCYYAATPGTVISEPVLGSTKLDRTDWAETIAMEEKVFMSMTITPRSCPPTINLQDPCIRKDSRIKGTTPKKRKRPPPPPKPKDSIAWESTDARKLFCPPSKGYDPERPVRELLQDQAKVLQQVVNNRDQWRSVVDPNDDANLNSQCTDCNLFDLRMQCQHLLLLVLVLLEEWPMMTLSQACERVVVTLQKQGLNYVKSERGVIISKWYKVFREHYNKFPHPTLVRMEKETKKLERKAARLAEKAAKKKGEGTTTTEE